MSQGDMLMLSHRIGALLPKDKHQKGDSYRIRSLYLDDPMSNAMYMNEEGMDMRLKLRVRFYDNNIDHLLLEVKEKVHGKTVKDACPLSRRQFEDMLEGIAPRIESADTPRPLVLLATRMRTENLRPAVIVEYRRAAYCYPGGNTRVTFDQNVSASTAFDRFLEPQIPLMPIFPVGQQLIEVKFDDRLPGEVAQLLETNRMLRIAFSKYTLSRIALQQQNTLPMQLIRSSYKKGVHSL